MSTRNNLPEDHVSHLKEYLQRLGNGEDLERVRADFVKEYRDVDAAEIMQAEQELLREGTPLEEVQKLCDVHAALFHGMTIVEKIQSELPKQDYTDKSARALELEQIVGHPLYCFTKENEALEKLLTQYRKTKEEDLLTLIHEFAIHYAKKGDLLYPHLKVRYGISGPSDVMWTVDDEIRDEVRALMDQKDHDDDWHLRMESVLGRVEEMIYKEQNILFPNCAVNFTQTDWYGIYQDAKDYADCFGVGQETWEEAEQWNGSNLADNKAEGEIVLPGGHLTIRQLRAMLNAIPLEISFVDEQNINRFFNEGPKVFKRPGMALDREVFSCHPPKIEKMVRSIIEDFRAGKRDRVPVWMDKGGRTMLVTYMAVRDEDGGYLGTMELVQDMEFAKEYFRK